MKKLFVLVGLAGVLSVTTLQAAMTVQLQQGSGYSHDNGGEFRAVPGGGLNSAVNYNAYATSTSDGNYFQTFCIEYNEHFNPGATYNVSISQNAMFGGQPTGGDPISIGTAWLYSQFAAGTLTGYDYSYGSGRSTSAGLLQQAIWWLEGEGTGRNAYVDLAEIALGNLLNSGTRFTDAQIIGNANGAFNVRALNLGAPGVVQDQLVMVPVPEATTMVAGALLLLPLGASALRILRRNRAA